MARGVNKVILLGNLGKDPEVKYTPSGMAIARFSLATTERAKDKEGNWQDKTEWHNLVAFGRTAEIAGEYLKKGRTVYIEGALHSIVVGRQRDRPEEIQDRNHRQRPGNGRRSARGRRRWWRLQRRTGGGAKAADNMDQRVPDHEETPAPAGEITDEDIPF